MKTKKRKHQIISKAILYTLLLLCGQELFAQLPAIREQRLLPRQIESDVGEKKFYVSKNKLQEIGDLYFGKKGFMKDLKSSKNIDSIIQSLTLDSSVVIQDFEFERRLKLFNDTFQFFENSDTVYINKEINDESIKILTDKAKVPVDTISNFYYDYYNLQIRRLNSEINLLKGDKNGKNMDELMKLEQHIKKKNKFLEGYKEAIEKIEKNFKEPQAFLPTFQDEMDKELAFSRIYSKRQDKSIYLGNSAALQVNGTGAIIESELLSAYLSGLRVSFGSLITNTNEDDEMEQVDNDTPTTNTEAFQRLLAGGGNLYLGVELPLLFYQTNRFSFYTNISGRLNLEVSEFSDQIDSSSGNGNTRVNFYTSISTDNREFTFFSLFHYGLYFGSDEFYGNLSIEDDKEFAFGELTAGFTINNSIRIALTFNTISSEENLRSGRVVIGAQILSGLFE
ncbi:hypothetical protein [Flagellimonas beolgyonensis]|uniref:hypothetical protein n=1 Tax=Flagellimonas beolgyonensis TaxID=864064 RepID=UPI003D65EBA8